MTLREQLKRDEGERLKPYRDSVGKLTIGVGRNLDDVGLSPDEVDYLLSNDIRRAQEGVLGALPWTIGLDEPRFAVLVNMAFNMGLRGMLGFRKMLEAVAQADYESAAAELLDSTYAQQVGQRAQRLARQLVTGEWQ